jgi:hypothetical protein
MGILTASQKDFLYSFVTAQLWQHPETTIAIFIHNNRSEQISHIKQETFDGAASSSSDDGESMSVRDSNRAFQKEFEKKNRNLEVKDLRAVFEPSTVYGKRAASIDGFMVVAKHKGNIYKKSALWKRGVATGVSMLPRKDYRKTPTRHDTGAGKIKEDETGMIVQQSKLGLGSFFTPVQVLKQVTGGVSFFSEVIDKLHTPASLGLPVGTGYVCVDLFGYDGYSAEACINASTSNMTKKACVTVCHSYETASHTQNIIARHVHELARNGQIELQGFPKFEIMVNALKTQLAPMEMHLSVTTLLACGSLVVNDSLGAKWSNNEWTKEAHDLVHNVLKLIAWMRFGFTFACVMCSVHFNVCADATTYNHNV